MDGLTVAWLIKIISLMDLEELLTGDVKLSLMHNGKMATDTDTIDLFNKMVAAWLTNIKMIHVVETSDFG